PFPVVGAVVLLSLGRGVFCPACLRILPVSWWPGWAAGASPVFPTFALSALHRASALCRDACSLQGLRAKHCADVGIRRRAFERAPLDPPSLVAGDLRWPGRIRRA